MLQYSVLIVREGSALSWLDEVKQRHPSESLPEKAICSLHTFFSEQMILITLMMAMIIIIMKTFLNSLGPQFPGIQNG